MYHFLCMILSILLIMTIVVLKAVLLLTKSLLLGMKCVSKHDLQIFVLKLNKYE